MSVHVNIHMPRIMCMPINVGIPTYATYANCQMLSLFQYSCRPQAYNYIKKRLQHRVFSLNFVKLLRAPFSQAPASQTMKVYI